jgi:hypothetical protein
MINLISIIRSPGVLITDAIEGCQLSAPCFGRRGLDGFRSSGVVVARIGFLYKGHQNSDCVRFKPFKSFKSFKPSINPEIVLNYFNVLNFLNVVNGVLVVILYRLVNLN